MEPTAALSPTLSLCVSWPLPPHARMLSAWEPRCTGRTLHPLDLADERSSGTIPHEIADAAAGFFSRCACLQDGYPGSGADSLKSARLFRSCPIWERMVWSLHRDLVQVESYNHDNLTVLPNMEKDGVELTK
jgi:hypothetical protein